MKKLFAFAVMVGLCGAAAVYLSSCAKQAGPLSPSLDLLSAGSNGVDRQMPIASQSVYPASVSQTAKYVFSIPMDPASVNSGTVLLYTQDNSGVSETQYTQVTVSYNPATREVSLTPSNGAWATSKYFHVVITTGVHSISGRQLDSNANQIAESGEFDNYHNTFGPYGTPTPVAPGYTAFDNVVTITGATWASNYGGNNIGQYTGNISTMYTYVTITVSFGYSSTLDATTSWAMDTSTFFTSATALHPNVVFTDQNGAAVAPVNVTVTGGLAYNTLQMAFNLSPATKYRLSLKGGVSGIRSTSADSAHIYRGMYFDGNNNGVREASDDTQVATLETAASDNGALPRLSENVLVPGSDYDATLRRITLHFTITANYGTGTLDPASVNNSTIRLVDMSATPNQYFTPSSLVVDNGTPGTPMVYVYVPLKFNNDNNGARNVQVNVQGVTTSEGLAMDQNNDHVNGTPADYYQSPNISIVNYR